MYLQQVETSSRGVFSLGIERHMKSIEKFNKLIFREPQLPLRYRIFQDMGLNSRVTIRNPTELEMHIGGERQAVLFICNRLDAIDY